MLHKVIVEQQKTTERLLMDNTQTHIFMTGIPNEHTINGVIINHSDVIVKPIKTQRRLFAIISALKRQL